MNYLRIGICLWLIAAWACTPSPEALEELPFYSEATMTPQWVGLETAGAPDFHRIADFSLQNQAGEWIDQESLRGKIYLANFFFTTCPGICPKMTSNMQRLQDAFQEEEEVMLVSHTVMPWVDSVAQLQVYAEANDVIAGKWHLLTQKAKFENF